MNKKDCERIVYILADTKAPPHVVTRFVELDQRILAEYEGYAGVEARHEAVQDRYDELMTEKFGRHWCLRRDKTGFKSVYEQAVKDVYGDDFHPSLLK